MVGASLLLGFLLTISVAKPLTSDVFIDHEKCKGCGACEAFAPDCVKVNDDGKACFVHAGCGFIDTVYDCQNALCYDCEETDDFVNLCPESAIIR